MRTGKAHGPSEVSLELIAARGGVGIQVMAEICQGFLGFGMPVEWVIRIVVPIFKGKGDIRNCRCYRAVKRLEQGLKVVKRVLEKRLSRIVSVDEMQFCFMPERGTIDAIFILRRMQEEYHTKGKKIVYVFCGPRESLSQSTKQSVGMGIAKEKNTKSFGYISDESV